MMSMSMEKIVVKQLEKPRVFFDSIFNVQVKLIDDDGWMTNGGE